MKSCYDCIHCNEYEDRCLVTEDWIFDCKPEECKDRVVKDDKERNAAEDP